MRMIFTLKERGVIITNLELKAMIAKMIHLLLIQILIVKGQVR
jgi:hypothetical protein